MRKPATAEARIRRLCLKHGLRSVELRISEGVSARALPTAYNPLVDKRREEALLALGRPTVTMDEATKASTDAMERPVATGQGSDIAAALTSLEMELAKLA